MFTAMRSATASAWVRSSRPLRKARWVNSPGPAFGTRFDERPHDLALDELRAVDVELHRVLAGVGAGAAQDEGESFVEDCAVGVAEAAEGDGAVGDGVEGFEKTLEPKARASLPEMRTTAIPPAPGAVEMAQIVAPSTASRRGSSWREFG